MRGYALFGLLVGSGYPWSSPQLGNTSCKAGRRAATSILRSNKRHTVENLAKKSSGRQLSQKNGSDGLVHTIRQGTVDSESILEFMEEAKNNQEATTRLYTVALQRLRGDKDACKRLLQDFVNDNKPISSYMAVALIQSYCTESPNDIQNLRLEQFYPRPWHLAVLCAAIRACAVKTQTNVAKAERLFGSHEEPPPDSLLLAMLAVYRAAQNVEAAEQLVKTKLNVSGKVWNALLQVCVECKAVETAARIMEENVGTPNIYQATTFLNCLLASNQREEACQYLLQLAENGPQPDNYAVLTVLRACQAEPTITFRILEAVKDGTLQIPLTQDHYNFALSACDDPMIAKDLIQEMRFSRRHRHGAVPPTYVSYTKALVTCRKAADLTTAKSLLKTALNDGLIPDVFMYTTAVWTAARAKNCRAALSLLEQMTEHGIQPTIVSYNGALAAAASQGQATKAHDLVVALLKQNVVPAESTYYFLTTAVLHEEPINRQSILASILDHLDVDAMRSFETVPLLRELVRTCGLTGDIDQAQAIMRLLGDSAEDSVVLAFAKICSEARTPRWNETVALVNSKAGTMSKHLLSRLYSYAIVAFARTNRWVEALGLLETCFTTNGLHPSVASVNSLISACGRGDRPDIALSIFYAYASGDNRVPFNENTYRSAIMACARAERRKRHLDATGQPEEVGEWWECALFLLRRMTEQGLDPDPVAISSTISACEAAGKWKAALRTLQSAMEKGLDCNLYCFNAAIAACQKGGAWVEALDIYERLKDDDRLKPNIVTMGSLIEALDDAGQTQLATSLYTEGVRNRYLSSPWKLTNDTSQNEILAIDLHNFSSALAKAALRSYFETLLQNSTTSTTIRPFVIIVGKGSRIDVEPVLKSVVASFLMNEYGILPSTESKNHGRLIVSKADLQEYARKGSG